jgi:hypothetical protein
MNFLNDAKDSLRIVSFQRFRFVLYCIVYCIVLLAGHNEIPRRCEFAAIQRSESLPT